MGVDAWSPSISNHDTEYVEPEWFGPRTLKLRLPP